MVGRSRRLRTRQISAGNGRGYLHFPARRTCQRGERTRQLFTPVFTPARFFIPSGPRNFQQVTAPQAQMQFAAERCPLYPQSGHVQCN